MRHISINTSKWQRNNATSLGTYFVVTFCIFSPYLNSLFPRGWRPCCFRSVPFLFALSLYRSQLLLRPFLRKLCWRNGQTIKGKEYKRARGREREKDRKNEERNTSWTMRLQKKRGITGRTCIQFLLDFLVLPHPFSALTILLVWHPLWEVSNYTTAKPHQTISRTSNLVPSVFKTFRISFKIFLIIHQKK